MSGPKSVLNATGVVTGRNVIAAPFPVEAMEQMARLARAFVADANACDETARLLIDLTAADDGLALNTRAGATLLALSTYGAATNVIVSRGELLESGDGVRISELIEQAGGRLVEIGSVNRTRLDDYERALSSGACVLLKIRPPHASPAAASSESVSLEALASLARRSEAPLFYEMHGGDLDEVSLAVGNGVDLISFCGEAVLGAAQSGLLIGTEEGMATARSHLLAKALRLDTLRQAALEQTLALLKAGRIDEVPALRMRSESLETVGSRASLVAACIGDEAVVSLFDAASDGARPASVGVVVAVEDPEGFASLLRDGEPAVLARSTKDAVLLDARTLFDRDVMPVAIAIRQALATVARRAGQGLSLAQAGEQETAREGVRGQALNEG